MRRHILFLQVVVDLIVLYNASLWCKQKCDVSADLITLYSVTQANVCDVGKSLAICRAPDWMKSGKKRTRKSDRGHGDDRNELVFLVYAFTAVYFQGWVGFSNMFWGFSHLKQCLKNPRNWFFFFCYPVLHRLCRLLAPNPSDFSESHYTEPTVTQALGSWVAGRSQKDSIRG